MLKAHQKTDILEVYKAIIPKQYYALSGKIQIIIPKIYYCTKIRHKINK